MVLQVSTLNGAPSPRGSRMIFFQRLGSRARALNLWLTEASLHSWGWVRKERILSITSSDIRSKGEPLSEGTTEWQEKSIDRRFHLGGNIAFLLFFATHSHMLQYLKKSHVGHSSIKVKITFF
jgi:hypothetical protein